MNSVNASTPASEDAPEFHEGGFAYYSAEDLADVQDNHEDSHVVDDDVNFSGNDVSLGGTVEHNTLATPEVPSSVRSFSRNSSGYNLSLPNSGREAFYSINTDAHTLVQRHRILNPDSSVPSSPTGTAYGGGLSLTRSRSALASPSVYTAMLSPSSPTETVVGSPNGSQSSLIKRKLSTRRTKSTALLDSSTIEKPWLEKPAFRQHLSYWLTWSMILLCGAASILIGLAKMRNVQTMGKLCMVLEDHFDNGLDHNVWTHEVDMGGFG